jgi:cyclohexyl-isocyanide hydratase
MASVKPIFPEVTMSAPSPTSTPLQIGLVLFPKVTQLDFTGPLQVFSSLPGAKCI